MNSIGPSVGAMRATFFRSWMGPGQLAGWSIDSKRVHLEATLLSFRGVRGDPKGAPLDSCLSVRDPRYLSWLGAGKGMPYLLPSGSSVGEEIV